jgi:hypothetical protein
MRGTSRSPDFPMIWIGRRAATLAIRFVIRA